MPLPNGSGLGGHEVTHIRDGECGIGSGGGLSRGGDGGKSKVPQVDTGNNIGKGLLQFFKTVGRILTAVPVNGGLLQQVVVDIEADGIGEHFLVPGPDLGGGF